MATIAAVVFDLDGTLWTPDMYQLWGGGAPFTVVSSDELTDTAGARVLLCSGVTSVLEELTSSDRWSSTAVCVASCTDEPAWASECMKKFRIGSRALEDCIQQSEIYKASKKRHLTAIAKQVGCDLKNILFFDNELHNCKTVASMGVTTCFVPEGLTEEAWAKAVDKFPQNSGGIIK